MMSRDEPAVRNQFLDSLSPGGKHALLTRAVERRFSTGELLWSAGDASGAIALVLEGKVRIVRGTGGRQTVIHSSEPGATLGEVPFFTGDCYPATAIAAEPTRCLFLSHSAVREVMSADPEVALYFLRRLSLRVKSLVERMDENAATSVQTRLARFILQRSEKTGGTSRLGAGARRSTVFSLAMTQSALAEELGTVREVVVRALRALRELGAIERTGDGKYRIGDLAVLKAIAGH